MAIVGAPYTERELRAMIRELEERGLCERARHALNTGQVTPRRPDFPSSFSVLEAKYLTLEDARRRYCEQPQVTEKPVVPVPSHAPRPRRGLSRLLKR